MRIVTIGFKRKSASEFFPVLKTARVGKLIDVRRSNSSQLAGFTKGSDLKFFLEECFGIAYEHIPELGPPKDLLKEYRNRLGKKKRDDAAWDYYVDRFRSEVLLPSIIDRFQEASKGHDTVCFLCSEETAEQCHRSLLAEYIRDHLDDVRIEHL